MLLKKRLIPILKGSKTVGLISFYIGNLVSKYVRKNPWSILDDEPETGTTCFIDQCITDKKTCNHNYTWKVWKHFNNYIRQTYPKVKKIRWNRLKGGIAHVYTRSIK